jgi:hypothetical protein
MPYAFPQSEHPFGQCEHFSQVEPFEKPWFLVVKHAIVASEGFLTFIVLSNYPSFSFHDMIFVTNKAYGT